MKKTPRLKFPLLALLLAGLAAVPPAARAHHAITMFDAKTLLSFKGTVRKFLWTNPHCWLYLAVQMKDGSTENWRFETGSPNQLDRQGWNYHDIKAGDVIRLDANQSRSGAHVGSLNKVYLANGQTRGGMPGVTGSGPQGRLYN